MRGSTAQPSARHSQPIQLAWAVLGLALVSLVWLTPARAAAPAGALPAAPEVPAGAYGEGGFDGLRIRALAEDLAENRSRLGCGSRIP